MNKPSYNRAEVVASVSSFYKLLTQLPYIDPECLVYPPNDGHNDGWTGIDEAELRKRGKTDDVIDLLRHLPYLRQPTRFHEAGSPSSKDKRWMISPDTVAIAYCDGETYDENMDQIQPTPGHCIWLTDFPEDDDDGKALLFDSHTGTITEYSKTGQNIVIDRSDYEELPLEDRWMAYPTVNVVHFFHLWERKFDTLAWMAVFHEKGKAGTALWFIGRDSEVDYYDVSEESDDESYVPDSDEADSSGEDDGYEWDSEYEREPEYDISDNEEDSYQYQIPSGELPWWKENNQQDSSGTPGDTTQSNPWGEASEIYRIHLENGWPANFDREKCQTQLAEYVTQAENQT